MNLNAASRVNVAIAAVLIAGWSLPARAVPPDAAAAGQDQTVAIVLSGPGGRQPRLAIPDFILSGSDPALRAAAGTVARVLWQDLEFEEEFYLIPEASARSVPAATSVETLPLADWSTLGADYVLMTWASRNGDHLQLEVRVVSVTGDAPRRERFRNRYPDCRMNGLRDCAHTIADSLHRNLRNLTGVAMTRLAFVSDRNRVSADTAFDRPGKEVFLSDYDGAGQMPVTANRVVNISPSWSPDGRLLAYSSFITGLSDIYVKSIYEVRTWKPAGGGDRINNYQPAFSPDGQQIAFVSNRDGPFQIYVVAADGRTPARRLTNTRAYEGAPTWSPTGHQIAFTSDRLGEGTPRLYVMNADGTGQEALPYSGRAERPAWSPTGERIAFTCGKDAPYNICTINVRTGEVRQMLPLDGFSNEQPAFAPNGRHIVFRTNRWGANQIAIMNLKGDIKRRVTDVGNNTFPAWSHRK